MPNEIFPKIKKPKVKIAEGFIPQVYPLAFFIFGKNIPAQVLLEILSKKSQ